MLIGEGTAILGGPRATAGTMAECDQVFARLTAPPHDALHGVYRGRIVSLAGLHAMPSPVRRPIAVIAPRLRFPWYGKAFDGPNGANVWLTSTGRFRRFDYGVEYAEGAARLSYDRTSNPRYLRRLEAEVRTLAPGRYLCRAIHRGKVLLYFTLEA